MAADDIQRVQQLISEGVDVNARDWDNNTPIHYLRGLEAVKLLIQNGADVDAKNKLGSTPLHMAVLYGYEDIVDLLILSGANIQTVNKAGETLLHWSIIDHPPFEHLEEMAYLYTGRFNNREGQVRITKKLLKMGLSPNARTLTGETPLHYATVAGGILSMLGDLGVEIIEMLLQHGADVNARNTYGITPKGDQYARPSPEILEILEHWEIKTKKENKRADN